MQLNNIPLISYEQGDGTLAFVLQTSFDQALALDGSVLTITDETADSAEIAYYGGYRLTGLTYTAEGYTRVAFLKKISPEMQETIKSLEDNLTITNRNVSTATDSANAASRSAAAANTAAEQNAEAIEALITLINPSFEE